MRGWACVLALVLGTTLGGGTAWGDPGGVSHEGSCGIGRDFARGAVGDPTLPGVLEEQFQNLPFPFPPPYCTGPGGE